MQLNVCLVAFAVAMVTAAPIASDEKLVNSADLLAGDEHLMSKRADELVYYGNQQNNPRPPAKKSDPSMVLDLTKPEVPQGEEDQGGVIVAHEATPVSADLENRIESVEANEKQAAKVDEAVGEAMESAMHVAASPSNDESGEETAQTAQTVESSAESTDSESDSEDTEEGSEASEANSDDVEKELQAATVSESESPSENEASIEEASTEDDADSNSSDSDLKVPQMASDVEQDEVQDFLNQLRQQNENEGPNNFDALATNSDPSVNNYYKNMYQYLLPQISEEGRENYYMPLYGSGYRRRRSSRGFRARNLPFNNFRNKRRTRRIKRDLMDDLALSTSGDIGDSYLSDADDYVPLSDDEVDYIYSKLLPYIVEAYDENGQADRPRYESLEPLRPAYPVLEEYEPEEEEVYEPEIPALMYRERPYEAFKPVVPVADDEYPFEKRGMMEYYPAAPVRKRYFFPANEEPDTHWGAFVPEKRTYDEAMHRLRRLAMALSNERGPYLSDLLRDYKK